MKIKKTINIFIAAFLVALLFIFFNQKEKIIVTAKDFEQFNNFDVIVSSGQSVQSKLLNLINFSSITYSHIGIVVKNNNEIYILHSTPDGTKENGIRLDNLQKFIDLSNVNYYKILRSKKTNKKKNLSLINIIVDYRSKNIPFDYNFNNLDKNEIYCSELVYDILTSNELLMFELDLSRPIHPKTFLKMSDLTTVIERKSIAN